MSKVITVFGATGAQGGSVVDALLQHPVFSKEYKIRGTTRDVSKPASQSLAAKGVEMVAVELSDRESVSKAIEGSKYVFGLTNFWDPLSLSKEKEIAQGITIADACKEAGVDLLIWSSLPYASKISNGKYKNVLHFDAKAEVENYIRAQNIPAVFLLVGGYMKNLTMLVQKTDDGKFNLSMPFDYTNQSIAMIHNTTDTGKFVTSILSKPAQCINRQVYGASGWCTPEDICTAFSKVTGKKLNYTQVSDEDFKKIAPEPMGTWIGEAWAYCRDYEYFGPGARKGVEEALKIFEGKTKTVEDWFQENGPW